MARREHIEKLIQKSKEAYFPGKGGGLFLREERPRVLAKDRDRNPKFTDKAVNYLILYRALLRAQGEKEVTEVDGSYSVKIFNEEKDFVISFKHNDRHGAVAFEKSFKARALLMTCDFMKRTVPFHQESFECKDGSTIKIIRKFDKVMFGFFNTYIEIPAGEQQMLKLSLFQLLAKEDLKPFLGTVIACSNKEGFPAIIFGIGDFVVETNFDVAYKMLSLIS